MRVTSLIREYVKDSVEKVYAPKIDACGADYRKKTDEVNKILTKLVDEFNTTAKEIIKENGLSINIEYGTEDEETTIIYYRSKFGSKEYEAVAKEINALLCERSEKIREILLTLELGGTKAELDEMLKKLKEEVVG